MVKKKKPKSRKSGDDKTQFRKSNRNKREEWKRRERQLAALFGTVRSPNSGASEQEDGTSSDSRHATLYLECKTKRQSATHTLYAETKSKARKEGKTPVLGIAQTGSQGMLIVIHENDLLAVSREYIDELLMSHDFPLEKINTFNSLIDAIESFQDTKPKNHNS